MIHEDYDINVELGKRELTQQAVLKWLREVYNIFIEIIIFRENMVHYRFKILNRDCEKIYIDNGSQFSYEEAVEAALKYTLENLI